MAPEHGSRDADFRPSPDFLRRQQRLNDVLNLRQPDRVPVAPIVLHYFVTKQKGVSNKDAMYELEQTHRLWRDAVAEYGFDAAIPYGPLLPVRQHEIMQVTQLKWPGHGLPDDQPFQWVEGEYMLQSEYDEMLANPDGFAVKTLCPRISKTIAPLSALATARPPILFYSESYSLPMVLGGMLGQPQMIEILEKLLALAKEAQASAQSAAAYVQEMATLGYPTMWGAVTFTAFDWVSDYLRGMKGTMMDMFQVPDKLLAAIDMFIPLTIGHSIEMAKRTHNKGVFIPMHRGADGFMSDEQFAKFYWPSFRALILGLIDAGLTPMPLFEGNFTTRLKYLSELPPKKILGHFDMIDRKKAKEAIGDVMCFWGNVPASLMCAGTPEEVEADVRELISLFGENGGLILDSTMGIPDEARPENVQAMVEAAHKYGTWR